MNMQNEQSDRHLEDQELLMHADGELSEVLSARVSQHLASCWSCRARQTQLEETIAEFMQAHQGHLNARIPAAEGPRAKIKAQLAAASLAPAAASFRERLSDFLLHGNRFAYAGAAFMISTVLVLGWGVYRELELRAAMTPDPILTPGATATLSEAEVCENRDAAAQPIPASLGREVFARYGVDPGRMRYELDSLIAPELGGAMAPENFWPQPYSAPGWNAHVKDALEDRLYQLVCDRQLSLAEAQHDIATDWIEAYKKYFQTDQPIASHVAFYKDEPWQP